MKTKWLSIGAAFAITATSCLVVSAAGNPVFIEQSTATLTAGQKTALGGWVNANFGANAANVDQLHCFRHKDTVKCRVLEEKTATAASFVDMEAAGQSAGIVSADGDSVVYLHSRGYVQLTGSQIASLVAWLGAAWPAISASSMRAVTFDKDGSVATATLRYQAEASAADYVAKLLAGSVLSRVE